MNMLRNSQTLHRRTSPQRRGGTRLITKNSRRSKSPEINSVKGIIGNPDEHLTRTLATQSYITQVKATFKRRPEIYSRFVYLLGELHKPSNNAVATMQEIVHLFEGYPHLIHGLNGFLPYNCELQIQPDAVIIKAHDAYASTEAVMKRATNKASQATDYLNNVKLTLGEESKIYREFLKALQEYHHNKRGNKGTVRKVVKLLREYPELVFGFNAFLPEGFTIEIEGDKICKIQDKTGEISTINLSVPEGTSKIGRGGH